MGLYYLKTILCAPQGPFPQIWFTCTVLIWVVIWQRSKALNGWTRESLSCLTLLPAISPLRFCCCHFAGVLRVPGWIFLLVLSVHLLSLSLYINPLSLRRQQMVIKLWRRVNMALFQTGKHSAVLLGAPHCLNVTVIHIRSGHYLNILLQFCGCAARHMWKRLHAAAANCFDRSW